MRSFLDMAAERVPKRGELTICERVEEIRLDEVVYQYPGTEEPAVDGVSLTLHRGETLAIVGENGSGKSTLAKLITGILLADKGRVLWDSTDLADTRPDSVWSRTALVPQNFACWPLRARENITLGQPKTFDDGPVWAAVDAVGMRKAVEKLPKQLDTLLAKNSSEAPSCPEASGSGSRAAGPVPADPAADPGRADLADGPAWRAPDLP